MQLNENNTEIIEKCTKLYCYKKYLASCIFNVIGCYKSFDIYHYDQTLKTDACPDVTAIAERETTFRLSECGYEEGNYIQLRGISLTSISVTRRWMQKHKCWALFKWCWTSSCDAEPLNENSSLAFSSLPASIGSYLRPPL